MREDCAQSLSDRLLQESTAGTTALEQTEQRILFLDDSTYRARMFLRVNPHALWVKTAAECVKRLAEDWDEVHLDYDLGWGARTDPEVEESGMGVVYWMLEHKPEHLHRTVFIVHSHSSNAARHMADDLRSAGYHAVRRPFDLASGD